MSRSMVMASVLELKGLGHTSSEGMREWLLSKRPGAPLWRRAVSASYVGFIAENRIGCQCSSCVGGSRGYGGGFRSYLVLHPENESRCGDASGTCAPGQVRVVRRAGKVVPVCMGSQMLSYYNNKHRYGYQRYMSTNLLITS